MHAPDRIAVDLLDRSEVALDQILGRYGLGIGGGNLQPAIRAPDLEASQRTPLRCTSRE